MSPRVFLFLVLALLLFLPAASKAQCTACTVTITGNNAPSASISNNAVVCISGNRTSAINFNNSTGITICISQNSTLNASFNSLSGLTAINNYGTLSLGTDPNGTWTINNYGVFNFNTAAGSLSKTVNNFSTMNVSGNFVVSGILNNSGNLTVTGSSTVNSSARISLSGNTQINGALVVNANIGLAGTLNVAGSVQINSSGGFFSANANQCNSITVGGAFSSDGIISGSNLNYGGSGNSLFVNKLPAGNANPRLRNGAIVGSCNAIDCVEIIEIASSPTKKDVLYVFRCSDTLVLPGLAAGEEIVDAMALIVAGGGGGGMGQSAGGGGGGGVIFVDGLPVQANSPYPVVVGSGGIGATNTSLQGANGSNSSFFGFEVFGGGGGGSSSTTARNGRSGGSGGGGAFDSSGSGGARLQTSGILGGNILVEHGHTGGNGNQTGSSNNRAGGGGGGAGTQGVSANGFNPGNGGDGISSLILDGIPAFGLTNGFGAGGGATGRNSGGQNNVSLGGSVGPTRIGGDGNSTTASSVGLHGSVNSGSGGGAGRGAGGAGSSGVVIIRVSFRILPVEFQSLQALFMPASSSVKVDWSTAKEWNNSHFEIERSVGGISNFIVIGTIDGKGWSDQETNYTFDDNSLPAGKNNIYYRIKQVDFDGAMAYSKVVAAQVNIVRKSHKVWQAFPNPVSDDKLFVKLLDTNSFSGEKIQARIVHANMVMVSQELGSIEELNAFLQQQISRIPKGVFVIEIKWADKVEHLKVLKSQ